MFVRDGGCQRCGQRGRPRTLNRCLLEYRRVGIAWAEAEAALVAVGVTHLADVLRVDVRDAFHLAQAFEFFNKAAQHNQTFVANLAVYEAARYGHHNALFCMTTGI